MLLLDKQMDPWSHLSDNYKQIGHEGSRVPYNKIQCDRKYFYTIKAFTFLYVSE